MTNDKLPFLSHMESWREKRAEMVLVGANELLQRGEFVEEDTENYAIFRKECSKVYMRKVRERTHGSRWRRRFLLTNT